MARAALRDCCIGVRFQYGASNRFAPRQGAFRNMKLFSRLALGALILFSAGAALAQTSAPRTVRVGETVRGALESKELEKDRDWVVDYFDIQGQRGQTITIELKSDDFDAYIDFDKGDSHVTEDDDGGTGLDSRLVYEFPDNATYRINVTSSERDETGAYTLSVVRGGTPTVTATTQASREQRERPNPQEIRYGQTIQSRITEISPLHRDDTPYVPFVFRGRRGETVTIDMKSDAFDAYLVIQKPGGNDDLDKDDDGGEDTDAKLEFTLPEDGQYEIRANAVSQSAVGPFSLSLSEPRRGGSSSAGSTPMTGRAPSRSTQINVGQTMRGKLESGDLKGEDDSFYDAYRFRGQARQTVVIQLRSDDFDAYLSLLDSTGKELANNDDEDGTDSQITFTLPSSGEYFIMANSLSEGETGDYIIGLSVR